METIELQTQLRDLKSNLDRLIRNLTAVKNENEMLKQQIDAQRKTLAEKNHKIHELGEQLELVKTTRLIGENDHPLSKEDKSDVRHKINELIKEVDKCIAQFG